MPIQPQLELVRPVLLFRRLWTRLIFVGWRLRAQWAPGLSLVSMGQRDGVIIRFSLCCIFGLPAVDILHCLFQLREIVQTWLLVKTAKLTWAQVVPGSEPWCLPHNVGPLHPVVFWEARSDMRHDVKHKGTGLTGFSTLKGTFIGCHIILIVLKNGAQEYPHSLGPGSYISDPNLLRWWRQWKLPPGLQGTRVQD